VIVWADDGLILSVRRHGEADAVMHALTAERGRWAGVVRGGGGRRRAQLQPGAGVRLEWRARLPEHIGAWRVEVARDRAGATMQDAGRLAALASAAALLLALTPEREPAAGLYEGTLALFDALAADAPDWAAAYALWEVGLLGAVGFGLDLTRCAATGARHDLVWVSPRSGRAVSREAGAPWADRLLPLPGFLAGQGPADAAAVADALRMTGPFLERAARAVGLEGAPGARARLAARLGAG
jgi:DNA repair protein RecO (recombination protein O)